MALKIRAVTPTQIRSGSGTQDFTITGFGTPQAAIVHFHFGGTNDTDIAHRLYGVGFFDGTSQSCAYSCRDDAIAGTASSVVSGTFQKIFYAYLRNLDVVRASTAASFITDGLRITFDAGSIQPYITVILINGITAAKAGYFTPSATADATTNVTTTGVDPNALFCANSYHNAIDNSTGQAGFAFGFASKASGLPQRCYFHADVASNPNYTAGRVTDTAAVGGRFNHTGGSTRGQYELTAFGTGQFTITTRVGAAATEAVPVAYLALQTPVDPDVFTATAPTGTGDFDPYTGTGKPEAVLMVGTAMTAMNTVYTVDAGAGGGGFYLATRDTDDTVLDEFGAYGVSADGTTTNASTRMNTRLLVQGETGGAPTFEAYNPTFDATGLVYPDGSTSAASAAYKIIGIAFRDSSTTKYLKALVHSGAAGISSVAGTVFEAPTGGDITGAKLGEFTSASFLGANSLDGGKAKLLVAVTAFGGSSLTTANTPHVYLRTSSFDTPIFPATVIEA